MIPNAKQEVFFGTTDRRYRTYDSYLKEKFGEKCVKIGLDGGFTCPNRDGTKGFGGCTFCGGGGGETCGSAEKPLRVQYEEGRARLEKKWGRPKTIPYFQSYTSTYAPVCRLAALYEEALNFEDAVGLTIATRADALGCGVLELLSDIAGRTVLTVELGLQSVFDETARRINRCHTYKEFLAGYEALKKRGIAVCVHLINGLPGETPDMMRKSAEKVGALMPDFIKFHSLYVRKGTALCREYESGGLTLLTREEYIKILADQIEALPPETVVERLTGDPKREELAAPGWVLDKKKVLFGLDNELKRRGTYQGVWYNCTKS